jgi:hypothetical protein
MVIKVSAEDMMKGFLSRSHGDDVESIERAAA